MQGGHVPVALRLLSHGLAFVVLGLLIVKLCLSGMVLDVAEAGRLAPGLVYIMQLFDPLRRRQISSRHLVSVLSSLGNRVFACCLKHLRMHSVFERLSSRLISSRAQNSGSDSRRFRRVDLAG
jgi:hypothetical protein